MYQNLNSAIRTDIINHVAQHGKTDTRSLIDLLAKQHGTTKQRVSGNISALVRFSNISIIHSRPHSMIY